MTSYPDYNMADNVGLHISKECLCVISMNSFAYFGEENISRACKQKPHF